MAKKTAPLRRFTLLYAADTKGWYVYDRLRYRMSDGVYYDKDAAREVCDFFEREPEMGDRDWYAKERARNERLTWDAYRDLFTHSA